MAKGCQIDWKASNSIAILGEIDENADFSSFSKARGQILYVDLSAVSRLNSSGLRIWIQTMARNKIQLVLRECSPTVVEQYALVPEFIGIDGKVESFFARYHCDSCSEEKLKRFQLGQNLLEDKPELPAVHDKSCPSCGDRMSLDQSPDVYLSFLRNSYKPGSRAS